MTGSRAVFMKPFAYALAPLALAALLTACAKNPGGSSGPGGATRSSGGIGYVRMDDLVKRHPLYSQLSRLDDSVAALQLKSVVAMSGPALPPDQLRREQAEIQREFQAAADRARTALKQKQDEYAKREAEAIREALAAAGRSGASPGAATIVGSINRELQRQAQSVSAGAEQNVAAYRRQLLDQDAAALRALQRSLNERAARIYQNKVEQLQKKEADYALQLAQDSATERLSLRAKLSNLVLDEAAREEARKALEALDRKQADALAAMKNRDGATLAALQKELHDSTITELGRRAASMRAATLAKINKRELELRQQLALRMGALPAAGGSVTLPKDLPASLRAQLDALHKKYQDEFGKDAKTTLAQFEKTRGDLQRRLARLEGVDAGAVAGSNREIDALEKQRRELYDQMVAQIGREVKVIAARRGVNVVLSDVMAPAGGIDLTSDAEKDIESLHE